jgi:DNA-binding transcriptional MerR regulator
MARKPVLRKSGVSITQIKRSLEREIDRARTRLEKLHTKAAREDRADLKTKITALNDARKKIRNEFFL